MKKREILLSNRDGSFTIEVTLVIIIIFFCLISVIYLSLIMYQKVYLQTVVNSVAIEAFNNLDGAKENTYQHIEKKLKNFTAVKGAMAKINVETKNLILFKTAIISVEDGYNMPLGFNFKIKAMAKKSEHNPVDFIRKLDLIKELIVGDD